MSSINNGEAKVTTFPRLTGNASTGKTKVWEIQVVDKGDYSEIITTYGYEDGKMTTAVTVVREGKNKGKSNETTPYTQAVSMASSKWTKQKDKLKSESESEITSIPFPMLAHDYHKRGKDIEFPCFVQPKLDGVRCIAKSGLLMSRTGKYFSVLDHINNETSQIPFVLDGELYSDTLDFQTLTGIVNSKKEPDQDKKRQVFYVIYDAVIPGEPFHKRLSFLRDFFSKGDCRFVRLLDTFSCSSRDDVPRFHDTFVSQGYEGLILRNASGLYKEKFRSPDLQKFKLFQDAEFEIVDLTDGEGKETGCVIWICKNSAGQLFRVRPKGTVEQRENLYKTGSKYIGKMLTVVFQELTNDGLPRFPTTRHGGVADIRDYE